ncbi:MAG TPA: hypothetical protein VGN16_01835 [Acidobacteriaceae bacterium]|jgi:hypothetical protein
MAKTKIVLLLVVLVLGGIAVSAVISIRNEDRSLREMQVPALGPVFSSAFADKVLSPELLHSVRNKTQPAGSGDSRLLLVETWALANGLARSQNWTALKDGEPVSSMALTDLNADDRLDAWHQPFCIAATQSHVLVFSSGGKGRMDCTLIQKEIGLIESSEPENRLSTEKQGFLVLVRPRR